MTDQATRDADRELDLALEEEHRLEDAEELNKRTQRDLSDLPDMGRDNVVGRLGDYSHIEDPEHRAKLDSAFYRLKESLEDVDAKAQAEERAKRRMEARQAFTQRVKQRWQAVVRAFWTLVVLLAFAGMAWAGNNWQMIVPAWDKNATSTKNCIFKVGTQTVTGTRTSIYRFYQVLNWQFHDVSTMETETRIDVSGNGMSVLQYIDGKPEKLIISDGEKYRQLLKVADHYAIFMDSGKNAADISFNDMCK